MSVKRCVPAVVASVLMAGAAGCGTGDRDRSGKADASVSAPTVLPSSSEPPEQSAWPDQPHLPVTLDRDLWVGGERVPGEWWGAEGAATRWFAVRADRTWWWGNDAQARRMDGEVDQGPAMSADGRYLAYVRGSGRDWTLVAVDTAPGGGELGTVELPHRRMSPAPRAVAVTDDGLVVVGGPRFQWVWRPLLDGTTVDLAETAPGEAVLGGSGAGVVVNRGQYDRTDANLGTPRLARLSPDGTLVRLGRVPLHGSLEASERWLAYVPPGVIGGEAWTTGEILVEHVDGSATGVLVAPPGWRFAVPGFRWETVDQLVTLLVSPDENDRSLARCRTDAMTCELVDLPD